MKLSRRLVAGALGAGLLMAGFHVPAANAADTTDVTFTLTAGGLSVSVDEVGGAGTDLGSFSSGDLESSSSVISGALRATTVTDTRNSTAGWTVSASSTAFNVSGGDVDNAIPAANVQISIPVTQAIDILIRGLTESAGDVFVPDADGTNGEGGAIGTLTSTGLGDLIGGLTGGLLGGTSNHAVTYTPDVDITVPAGRIAGTYTGVITQTAT